MASSRAGRREQVRTLIHLKGAVGLERVGNQDFASLRPEEDQHLVIPTHYHSEFGQEDCMRATAVQVFLWQSQDNACNT